MPEPRLRLLSVFQLEGERSSTHLTNRRQDLLLAYLGLRPDVPHLRKDIAAALWPDKPDKLRMNRLTEVLVHAKRLFAEVGLPENTILAMRGILQLNPMVNTDLPRFEELAVSAWTVETLDEKASLRQDLKQMYGVGLLPLLSEPWVEEERRRLHALYVEAMRQLEATAEVVRALGPVSGRTVREAPVPEAPDRVEEPETEDRLEVEETGAQRVVALAEEAAVHLLGVDRHQWFRRLTESMDDIVSTTTDALDRKDNVTAAMILGHVWPLWAEHIDQPKARRWIEQALLGLPRRDDALYARTLHGSGILALQQGDLDIAESRLQEARETWQSLGNREGYARVVGTLGIIAYSRGDYEEAQKLYEESIALLRTMDFPIILMRTLRNAAQAEDMLDNLSRARTILLEVIAMCRALDDDQEEARTQISLASVYFQLDDHRRALDLALDSVERLTNADDTQGRAAAHRIAGFVFREQRQLAEAEKQLEHAQRLFRENGNMREVGETLHYLAGVYREQGKYSDAIEAFSSSELIALTSGNRSGAERARAAAEELRSSQE